MATPSTPSTNSVYECAIHICIEPFNLRTCALIIALEQCPHILGTPEEIHSILKHLPYVLEPQNSITSKSTGICGNTEIICEVLEVPRKTNDSIVYELTQVLDDMFNSTTPFNYPSIPTAPTYREDMFMHKMYNNPHRLAFLTTLIKGEYDA